LLLQASSVNTAYGLAQTATDPLSSKLESFFVASRKYLPSTLKPIGPLTGTIMPSGHFPLSSAFIFSHASRASSTDPSSSIVVMSPGS
jgi:hypothetical protein